MCFLKATPVSVNLLGIPKTNPMIENDFQGCLRINTLLDTRKHNWRIYPKMIFLKNNYHPLVSQTVDNKTRTSQ